MWHPAYMATSKTTNNGEGRRFAEGAILRYQSKGWREVFSANAVALASRWQINDKGWRHKAAAITMPSRARIFMAAGQ